MSADFLWFDWAFDPDGHPWVRHECNRAYRQPILEHVETWRLPPPWHLNDEGNIAPSLHCQRCDRHVFLYECDRLPWEQFEAKVATDA